ncbi:MAG: hypothetical protein ACXAE3_02835 [Candidatus Kariarchaeaceae archaeon]
MSELFELHQSTLEKMGIGEADITHAYLYPLEPNLYPVFELTPASFFRLLDRRFARYPEWRRRLTRGLTLSGLVFIKSGTLVGKKRLILHEIGHIQGRKHTWKPGLMHPSWLFRWTTR